MSQTIDQKVVELRFDNTQFEKAIGETQKTLKNFKSDLDFDKDSSNFGKLGDAADTVKLKFSALETVAITAIANITTKALNSAERIVKALSIDNISAGWQKYADKTSAIQTIMAAVSDQIEDEGERMEYVNEQIERLNWFTDETSYNLVDMTSNIGKFVAAGVDLPKAVDAMQGIATWAALSGANAQTASHAMSQLAQAMGTGVVKLQDWVSIENANMATKEFKEMAIDVARNLDKYVEGAKATLMVDNDGITFAPNTKKGTDVDANNFRASLAEGWFTSDVLTAVLERYGKFATNLNALSESMLEDEEETTSTLIKYIEDYKDEINGLSKDEILQRYAEKTGRSIEDLRKQFDELASDELGLKAFKAAQEAKTFAEAIQSVKDAVSTGWMNTFEKVFGTYDKARVLWTDLANDLWEVFNGGAEERNNILNKWIEGGGQEHVHDIIIGLTHLIIDFKEAWKEAIKLVFGESTQQEKANKLLEFTQKIRDFIKSLALFNRDEHDEIIGLTERGEKVVEVMKTLLKVVGAIGKIFITVFKVSWKIVKKVWDVSKVLFDGIITFFKSFKSFFDLKKLFQNSKIATLEAFGKKVEKPMSLFDKIAAKLREWASKFDKSKFLNSMRDWGLRFASFLDRAWDFIKDIPGKINDLFKRLFGINISDAIHKLWDDIKAFFKWLQDQHIFLKMWDGIKTFFGWIWNGLKSLLKVENFGQLIDKIKGVFGKVFDFIKGLFSKKTGGQQSLVSAAASTSTAVEQGEGSIEKSTSIISSIFEAIGTMIKALFTSVGSFFSAFDWNKVFSTIGTIASAFFGALTELIKKIDFNTLLVGLGGIVGILQSIAKLKLAAAVRDLAKAVKWMSGTIADLAVARKFEAFGYLIRSIALVIAAIAASIYVLGKVMTPEELMRGAITVGAFILALFIMIMIIMKATKDEEVNKLSAVSKSSRDTVKLMLSVTALMLAIARIVTKLVDAVVRLAAIEDTKRLWNAVGMVSALMGVCIALAVAILVFTHKIESSKYRNWKEGIFSKTKSQAATTILAMAGFILIFSFAIKSLVGSVATLANIEDGNALWRATAIIGVLSGAILILMVTLILLTKKIESSSWSSTSMTNSKTSKTFATLLAVSAMILAFSFAIRSLVSSIAILAGLNQNNLVNATTAVLGLILMTLIFVGAVLVVVSSFEKSSKTDALSSITNNSKAASAMLAVSVLMVAMAEAIQMLVVAISAVAFAFSKTDPGTMWQAFGLVVALMAALTVLSIAFAAFSQVVEKPSALLSLALVLVVFGLVIDVLVNNVIKVAMLLDKYGTDAERAFEAIAILVLELGVIAAALMGLSKIGNPLSLLAMAVAMIAIAGALRILMPAFVELSKMKFGNIMKAALGILAIMAAFAIGGSLMSVAVPGLLSFAALLLAIGVTIAAVALAVYVGAESLVKFADGIVYFSETIEEHRTTIISAARTIADAVIAAFATLLSSGLVLIQSFLSNLVAMSGSIFDMLVALGTGFLKAMTELVAPAVELGTTLLIETLKGLIEAMPTIEEFLLALLKSAFNVLIGITPDLVEFAVEFLTTLLEKLAMNAYKIGAALVKFVIGLIDALADDAGNLIDSLAALTENFFNAMSRNIGKFVSPAMKFIGLLIEEVASGLDEDVLKPIGKTITDSIELILGAPLAGVMGSVGMGLSEFAFQAEDFFDMLDKVDPKVLTALGSLGGFIAAITLESVVDGIRSIISLGTSQSTLGKFGKELVEFADPLITFSNKIKGKIDTDNIEAVGNACKVMAELQGMMPLTGGVLKKIVGEVKDLGTFGTELGTFGTQFSIFYSSIKDLHVNKEVVETVSTASETMAGLYSLMPLTGGILHDIIGEVKSLGTFGNELSTFGNEFKKFYQAIATLKIKTEVVDTVKTIAESFAGLYSLMPLTGGILQDIIGEIQSLGEFGEDMKNFADGFIQFSNTLSSEDWKYDEAKIKSIIPIVEAFAGLYDSMPLVVNVMGFISAKRQSLSTFGLDMQRFANGFVKFSDTICSDDYAFSQTKIDSVTSIAQAYADLYDQLIADKTLDRMLDWFADVTHTSKLEMFGGQMESLGRSLANFANTVSDEGIHLDRLEVAKKYLSAFTDFALNLGGDIADNAASNIFSIDTAISTVITSAQNWANNHQNSSPLADVGSSVAKSFFTGVRDTFNNFDTIFKKMVEGSSLNNYEQTLRSTYLKFLEDFPTLFNKLLTTGSFSQTWQNTGKKIVTLILSGMSQRFYEATNGTYTLLDTQINLFASHVYDAFYTYFTSTANQAKLDDMALWLVQGLVNGVYNVKAAAQQAGYDSADSYIRGFDIRSEIASPSKAMYQRGMYLVQGLVNGINSSLYASEESGESIAETALDGFQRAMLTANDYITDAMDGPLTLTPVLDLSEIQNGTAQLSQMMSSVDGYQLDGSARFASDAYMSRHSNEPALQSASVDRLTNAIEDLIQNPQNNLTNTFNINGTNAHEIAEEVSRILQMQVDRRQAVWG